LRFNSQPIRSLSALSLAKEHQVNEKACSYQGHDHRRQVLRNKERIYRGQTSLRQGATAWQAMTTMMINDGKRVATDGAGFQGHRPTIADIDRIARCIRTHLINRKWVLLTRNMM